MKLREEVHRSVDELDGRALAAIYEQIQLFQRVQKRTDLQSNALSRAKLLEMTASDTSSWSDAVIEDREDRL